MNAPPNGDDALVMAWASVARAVDAVQNSFARHLETLGMTLPYFFVLTLLYDADDQRLPMSKIARDLAMTSGGFTKLADRMARDGLIDRRGSSGDRRVVFAALTPAGHEQAARATDAYRQFLRGEVLDRISREDLATLAEIADRLSGITGEPDGEPTFVLSPRQPDEPERRSGE
jgi:DNA-binding MarR family transcriptional regulator